jgi:hypothetical protein
LKDHGALGGQRVGGVAHHFTGKLAAAIERILQHDASQLAERPLPEEVGVRLNPGIPRHEKGYDTSKELFDRDSC